MYYIMHIPTRQFLYRRTYMSQYPKDSVSVYSEYELQGRNFHSSRIICKDISELMEWFTPKDLEETILFSDIYEISRSKKYLCEFTLIPIPE